MRLALFAIMGLLGATCAFGEESSAVEKFRISGTTLIFDTETDVPDSDNAIKTDDVDRFRDLLREHEGIEVLELNSSGGSVWASREMARIALDFELDTRVNGECFSSCVRLFLAGNNRQMTLGSKIGFHQMRWSRESIENYYNRWAESDGWDTPFEFAEWMYEDTQAEVHEDLAYMLERGVDPAFAIRTKGIPNESEWYPNRLMLTLAGVLRSAPSN